MSKNGRNRHKTRGAGGPGTHASAPRSLSAVRADRAVDALTPAFVRWFEEVSPGSAVAALECLEPIKAVLGRYMDTTAAADVTSLEPFGLSVAVSDEILAALDAADDLAGAAAAEIGGSTHFVVHSVGAFVEFLVETGRWSGSADQLAAVMDFLDTTAEADGGGGLIDVPEIPDDAALAAFSGLPLIRRATALLEWIGEGKPVTATGALRLRDIEAAAACVGVAVKGGTKRSGSPLPGTAGSAGPVPTVRSMYEVPLLAKLWNALEAAEQIKITSTKVVPSADSGVFLAGGPSERLQELVFFVDEFLNTAVLGWDPAQPWEGTVSGLQASLLLAAATSDPPEKARVLAAPDNAPPAERAMAGLLTGVAMGRLEELAELGLLTIDTHFRVPPPLIRCIANVFDDDWVLADLGIGQVPDDADVDLTEFEPGGVGPTEHNPADPETTFPAPALAAVRDAPRTAETPILQLKITLNDSQPAIWRRVLVPAGMPLPQLHQVIQAVFGWQDYHLHEFRVGGVRGTAYAPVNPDGDNDFYGEASRDESTARVGELLPAAGSSMGYTYDFGDNWVLAVKAEKILAADAGQLPRCTAGRGMAPAEDSGGTWGWANIVQAVNDPHHEGHQEYREWLGMLPGDTLDPKAFDLDEANQDLAGFTF
ncbi:plasmid pRiA4b ORF-3 family protein [Arthrobacter sp. AL12]|uniref:plasmid pRiA4b ORF-3 family protein n=1 Tax=Arthrobacter sp. AL12 TaxID=3042241 RepID=UPI00249AC87C|nr:plasmid pRiA4b ORF-3 family protein [Arthrobacter sp. AL12]MDI3213979.1 plasmid pRiA4b ORF-3 family protein [Arthrobacter sp. AL12]